MIRIIILGLCLLIMRRRRCQGCVELASWVTGDSESDRSLLSDIIFVFRVTATSVTDASSSIWRQPMVSSEPMSTRGAWAGQGWGEGAYHRADPTSRLSCVKTGQRRGPAATEISAPSPTVRSRSGAAGSRRSSPRTRCTRRHFANSSGRETSVSSETAVTLPTVRMS